MHAQGPHRFSPTSKSRNAASRGRASPTAAETAREATSQPGAAQEPLGQALLAARGETVHLAATLTLNRWGGNENVELRVLDLPRPA